MNTVKLSNDTPTALITGSAKRIGAVIARFLHQVGFRVIIHYRHSKEQARLLCDELNALRTNSAILMALNLNEISQIQKKIPLALANENTLDLLVNCASDYFPTTLEETTVDQWQALLNSNLTGPYFLIQACLPYLKKARGNIVNILDINAIKPIANFAIYCAAKAGLAMLTKALAIDLAPHIRVNGVAPGITLWAENDDEVPIAKRDAIIAAIPLQKLVDPIDIAKAVLFLQQTASMTGEIIRVDGGRLLR